MGLRVTFPEGQSQRFFFEAPSSALWFMPTVHAGDKFIELLFV